MKFLIGYVCMDSTAIKMTQLFTMAVKESLKIQNILKVYGDKHITTDEELRYPG